jgi:hypothetical protein
MCDSKGNDCAAFKYDTKLCLFRAVSFTVLWRLVYYTVYRTTNFLIASIGVTKDVHDSNLYSLSFIIWPFILLSVLRPVHTTFKSEFSTECDLVLPFCVHSIVLFPSRRPLTAYVFFFDFLSLLPSIFTSVTCRRSQILRNVWTIQLAILLSILFTVELHFSGSAWPFL